MIQLMKRLLEFSGKQRKNLIASFVFNLLDSVFEMMPIMAILTVLSGLLSVAEGGVMPVSAIWVSLAIMVVSIAGRIFFNNLSCIRRTLGSFSMCSEKRLEIGEHMKHVPMGYFNENRLGEIVAGVHFFKVINKIAFVSRQLLFHDTVLLFIDLTVFY